jgi:hypothetical protein
LARSGQAAAAPPMPLLPQYKNEEGAVGAAEGVELTLTAGFMDAAAAAAAAAMSASDAVTLASTLDDDGVGSSQSQLALCWSLDDGFCW